MSAVQTSWSPPPVEEQLAVALERLVREFDPLRIYLYGSQARGDAHAGSDIDLMLVMPPGFSHNMEQYVRASRALGTPACNVNVVFWSEAGFQTSQAVVASLPATVTREGRMLYER